MEMNKLKNHGHYYYTHSDFFNHSSDLVHAFLMKDYDIGMHEQEFFEINIISRGSGFHYINNNAINANEGDVFIIPPKISHGYVGGEGFDVFHVIMSASISIHSIDLTIFDVYNTSPSCGVEKSTLIIVVPCSASPLS